MAGKREKEFLYGALAGLAQGLTGRIQDARREGARDRRTEAVLKARKEAAAPGEARAAESHAARMEKHGLDMRNAAEKAKFEPNFVQRMAETFEFKPEVARGALAETEIPLPEQLKLYEKKELEAQQAIDKYGGEEIVNWDDGDIVGQITGELKAAGIDREVEPNEVLNRKAAVRDAIKQRDLAKDRRYFAHALMTQHGGEYKDFVRNQRQQTAKSLGMRLPTTAPAGTEAARGEQLQNGMVMMAYSTFLDEEAMPLERAMAEKLLLDAGMIPGHSQQVEALLNARGIESDQIFEHLMQKAPNSPIVQTALADDPSRFPGGPGQQGGF